MTFLWLIVWLLSDTPDLVGAEADQAWLVGLIVCVLIDVGSKVSGLMDRIGRRS